MSTIPPIRHFKFNWYNYLFPVVIQSDVDNENTILHEWLEDYEDKLDQIQVFIECNPVFGQKLQLAMDKLCDETLRYCFDFLDNSAATRLFKAERDAVRYIDCFLLDTVVGAYIRFYDEFMRKFKQWEYETRLVLPQEPTENGDGPKVRKQRPNIPKEARDILSAWFKENVTNPYPKLQEKERLSIQTGLSLKKVENWFINERSRKWHLYSKNIKAH